MIGSIIVVRITNFEEARQFKEVPEYIASLEDKDESEKLTTPLGVRSSTSYTLVNRAFAEEVVRRFNHENQVKKNRVTLSAVWAEVAKERPLTPEKKEVFKMVRVVQRCTNPEDARGSHSIRAEYVAEIAQGEDESDIWGKIEVENVDLAMDVVARFNWEHKINNSYISLASALEIVKQKKAEREKAAAVTHKPYTYDWWYEKGRIDRRVLASPHHSRVTPYMDGWEAVEDEDRNTHGEVDYITQ